MLSNQQRANNQSMLLGAIRYCKRHGFTRAQAHQHLVECLACTRVETDCHVDANVNVPESFNYSHDGVGEDHDSVGMFQQRAGWGPVGTRMSPMGSSHLFLADMTKRGLDSYIPHATPEQLGERVQEVQVSAFPTRYAEEIPWARRYLHYNFRWSRLLRAVNYPKI